jgi:hypothetical protein
MPDTLPPVSPLTRSEVLLAEKIGYCLMPLMRSVALQAASPQTGALATFCLEFEATQRARTMLPADASPMQRIELENAMLEMAGKFVAALRKAA